MEEDFIALVLADARITTEVSNRVTFLALPQPAVLPAITLTRISRVDDMAFSGLTGLAMTRMQADGWAATYAGAVRIGRALQAALTGFSGTRGGTEFCGIFAAGLRDSFEESGAAASSRLYRVSLDFMIHHRSI